jgi:excisionase family DNA binding protein
MNGGRLLDAREVADLLNVPETWVRAETRADRMPSLALGRYRRYSWDAVSDWLETQHTGKWRTHKPTIGGSDVR